MARAILGPYFAALERMQGHGHRWHPYRDGGWLDFKTPRVRVRNRASVDGMTSFILSAILALSDTCPLLESLDLEVLCQEHPLQRPPACGVQPSLDECVGTLKVLTACGLTECQYVNCADELMKVGCFERPAVCEAVAKCLNG